MDTEEKEPVLKTVTTVEIKAWDQNGKVLEHIKISQDGKEERLD